jgi:hypothetical protein
LGVAARTDFALVARHCQHIKLDLTVLGGRQLFHLNYISGRNSILLSPGADHRVHKASNKLRGPEHAARAGFSIESAACFPVCGRSSAGAFKSGRAIEANLMILACYKRQRQ